MSGERLEREPADRDLGGPSAVLVRERAVRTLVAVDPHPRRTSSRCPGGGVSTVAELGAATQRTVAERLGISEPSASRMTGILVELGLLESPIDPAGGNRRRLTLTVRGEQMVHECRDLLESRFADLVERSGVSYAGYARNTKLLLKALEAARLGGDVVTTDELRTLLALAARGDRGYVDTIAVGPDRHLVLPAGAPNGRGNPVATRTRGG